jgi:uncharacterized RDD family membrane protein YckC
MNNDSLRYAGFWYRLGAMMLDYLIWYPLGWAWSWGDHYRLFNVYCFIPSTFLVLFYNVYLVRRYGGTPGKLIVGIRVRKLNGDPVGYSEAILRELPDTILLTLLGIVELVPLFHMTDAEFASLSSAALLNRETALLPAVYKPLMWIDVAWVYSELVVLLTNRRRRALHDFIAGTVVVHVARGAAAKPAEVEPEVAG